MEREVVYVYNKQRALELLEREGEKIELHCVKNQLRICSSEDEIQKFYDCDVNDNDVEP